MKHKKGCQVCVMPQSCCWTHNMAVYELEHNTCIILSARIHILTEAGCNAIWQVGSHMCNEAWDPSSGSRIYSLSVPFPSLFTRYKENHKPPLPYPLTKQGHGYPCKRNVIRQLSPLQHTGNFLNTVVIYFLDIVFRNLIYCQKGTASAWAMIKRTQLEADNAPPSSGDVKNE